MADEAKPVFEAGQIIHHKKFDYRGVIASIDRTFSGSDDWYEKVARSRPPKDKPWYRVLVHGGQETYVAERHLELDDSGLAVENPALGIYFDELKDGRYIMTRPLN